MKRILIISPRFPPKNTPDQHRVRTSLPYFEKFGWKPTVLCLTPETTDGVEDSTLEKSIDAKTRVVRVRAWDEAVTRKFKFGHIDYRCLWPLWRAGSQLLAREKFDLIYFSTTVFLTFILAPRWKRKFGCKIVFDFQDPWFNATTAHVYDKKTAPGGMAKYQTSQEIARRAEAYALRAADHIVSVSEGYVRDLSARYPWLKPEQFSVIPFGAAPIDYDILAKSGIRQKIFEPTPQIARWVYVGRGGPDLKPALSVFFEQLARIKQSQPDLVSRLRVHFVGTNYSPSHRTFKVVEPIAQEFGVGDLVEEHSERVPYFEALSLMRDSTAVLLFGTVSADYTASKLFNCVLSGKPVLALFNEKSLVSQMAPKFSNVHLASFESEPTEPAFAKEVASGINWLLKPGHETRDVTAALQPYLAENLTAQQCAAFDRLFRS